MVFLVKFLCFINFVLVLDAYFQDEGLALRLLPSMGAPSSDLQKEIASSFVIFSSLFSEVLCPTQSADTFQISLCP